MESGQTDSPVPAFRRKFLALFLAAMFLTLSSQVGPANPGRVVVIRDDPGGSVRDRVRQINAIRQSGATVEIRGRYCMSACTLFLGLKNTCVSPRTVFGFHGPGSAAYGIGLPRDQFDHWSRIMAAHYPEPIRQWFWETARHRIVGFHEVSGKELVRLGIRDCGGTS